MEPIKYLWTWFGDNQKHLRNYHSLRPKLRRHYAFWLLWHLDRCCAGLGYIINYPKTKEQKCTLTLTARGNQEHFGAVEALVAAAPKFRQWEVIAFVQPSADMEAITEGTDEPYIYGGITLRASEMKFEPTAFYSVKKMDMIVYVDPGQMAAAYDELLQAVYEITVAMLGEKLLHEHLNQVSVEALPEDSSGCLEFYDLQCYIELNEDWG